MNECECDKKKSEWMWMFLEKKFSNECECECFYEKTNPNECECECFQKNFFRMNECIHIYIHFWHSRMHSKKSANTGRYIKPI